LFVDVEDPTPSTTDGAGVFSVSPHKRPDPNAVLLEDSEQSKQSERDKEGRGFSVRVHATAGILRHAFAWRRWHFHLPSREAAIAFFS
jgi:hypothetical protein